ncbi:hypothetical protein [Streptomyces sp. NPDC059166]|uniref:hypothetical protein n=1 Tax=Streptomyces sp. NPDC059166 TaxID=3346752 RepID=UPI0036A9BBEE
MPLHEIRPGRAVAGLAMLTLAGGYAADARGVWDAPWTFFVPVLVGGLWLAATMTWVNYRLRRRRARRASAEANGAPTARGGATRVS